MFLQIDTRYEDENIKRFGCYYHSIAFHCNRIKNILLSPTIMEEHKKYLVHENLMGSDCYIKYPEEIFGHIGIDVVYEGHQPKDYQCENNQIEILCFIRTYWSRVKHKYINYKHFTAGNGRGIVTYDPMGVSNAVRFGELESKRIFTLY